MTDHSTASSSVVRLPVTRSTVLVSRAQVEDTIVRTRDVPEGKRPADHIQWHRPKMRDSDDDAELPAKKT